MVENKYSAFNILRSFELELFSICIRLKVPSCIERCFPLDSGIMLPFNSVKQLIIKNIQQGAYLLHHQMDHKSYYKQFSEDCAHTSV